MGNIMSDLPEFKIPGAFEAVVTAMLNRALIGVGAYLVGHGWATQEVVDQSIAPISQYILGVAVTAIGLGWAYARAKWSNKALQAAEPFVPNAIMAKKEDLK